MCNVYGTGNTGDKLSNDPDLYISRDGGVTWEEILAGSWGVNVADHGGLMVAAKDYHQEQSMVLKYSCDEGYSWKDFTFIDVRNALRKCVTTLNAPFSSTSYMYLPPPLSLPPSPCPSLHPSPSVQLHCIWSDHRTGPTYHRRQPLWRTMGIRSPV